ncbi:hypothetical protein AVEN_108276-1 [Araneus ventricosus]|uniref:Endonuclease/exonuclease/phosphatase domain-containing protein n=1 Tax=Araneus ventricosus TaxID=182803 RepID=A0A4Y2DYV9_ARAVE|nr:hypothetical protein AVEN_108276-1 [Araneus ventricosus]
MSPALLSLRGNAFADSLWKVKWQPFRNLLCYLGSDAATGSNHSGAVCILTSNLYPSTPLTLHTSLQAMAVQVPAGTLVTVCSVYSPPHDVISEQDLDTLVDQLPTPFRLGDFNGYSTLWGSDVANSRGRQIERLISNNCLCLLHNDEKTYFHEPTRTFLSLDLAICPPTLLPLLHFTVGSDLCNSDHFPIIVSHADSGGAIHYLPRYLFQRAGRGNFMQLADITESIDLAICPPTLLPLLHFTVGSDLCNSDHFPIIVSYADSGGAIQYLPRYLFQRADWGNFMQLADITESVDLAICPPTLLPLLHFTVGSDLCNGDHFPIIVSYADSGGAIQYLPRYLFQRADWGNFMQLADITESMVSTVGITEAVQNVVNCLLNAANNAVPKCSPRLRKFRRPWWNEACRDSRREEKKQKTDDRKSCRF